MTYLLIIISIISTIAAIFAAIYAYKAYWIQKTPKIVIESPFNNSLEIRNIGSDIAKNIREKSELLKDVPVELWNFVGPFEYARVKNPRISKSISFKDDKVPKPSSFTEVRFEYENIDGNKFYSEIIIERAHYSSQIYFNAPRLIKWGRIKKQGRKKVLLLRFLLC